MANPILQSLCNMSYGPAFMGDCYFQGDVWAESSILGFYWHYYALMEGHVFDITEWMKCHVSWRDSWEN